MDYKTILVDIQSYYSTRKMNILKLWDFYMGDNQRFYIGKFKGEDPNDFTERVGNASVENHCAKTCDTIVGYLYGNPESSGRVKVTIRNRKDKKINEEAMEFLSENVWRHNAIDAFRVNVGLMSSITGIGVVFKVFVDSRTSLPFGVFATAEEKKEFGTIRYDLWESADTIAVPLVDSQGNAHSGVLGAIVRITQPDAKRLMESPVGRVVNLMNTKYRADYFDSEQYVIADVDRSSIQQETIKSIPNPYKSLHIPFTLFRNYGNPMGLEGYSDIDQMVSLQTDLNELSTDDKTCIDYHSFPLLKLTKGAKLPPNFVRKANSALEMDGDQDADYLTWDNVLEASQKKQDSIRKQMTVVSGVSQLSRGNADSVGQVKGATALKTLFQADILEIGLKIPFFRTAEERLAESTLKMWEMETGTTFGDVYAECEFPADFIGIDKLLAAQTDQIEVTSGIASIREKIAARHPDITSEAELDALVQLVYDEAAEMAEAKAGPQLAVAKMQQDTMIKTTEMNASAKPQNPAQKSAEQNK
jgi:hypothetical protein